MQTHIAYLSMEQKARPIGVRVVEPPADTRQAVRGHLYAMIEFAGNQPEQAQLVEQALSVIQRTYYTVKGTQTFVLTEALREALNLFYETLSAPQVPERAARSAREQDPRTKTAIPGILLLSLIGNRMVIVGAGPAVALITTGSNVDVYPPYAPGVERDLQSPIDIHRQELSNGGAFLLAGQRCLQHFTLRELASIVAYVTEDNAADVAAALRSQAGADALTGLIVVLSPDEADEPVPAPARSPLQTKRRSGLPAALSTPPPARDVDRHLSARSATSSAQPQGYQRAASDYGYDTGTSDAAAPDEVDGPWQASAVAARPRQPAARSDPAQRGDSSSGTGAASVMARAKTTLDQARTIISGLFSTRAATVPTAASTSTQSRAHTLPPQVALEATTSAYAGAGPDEGMAPDALSSRHEQRPLDADAQYYDTTAHARSNDGASYADQAYGDQAYSDQRSSDRYSTEDYQAGSYRDDLVDEAPVHEPQAALPLIKSPRAGGAPVQPGRPLIVGKRASGRRARLFALAALLILLLTVVIVASVSWVTGSRNVAEAERTLDMAEASFLSAQSALDTDDKSGARMKLTEAQALINEATLLVGTRLERADQLNRRIEQELAGLLQIYPLQALSVPLVQFPLEAQPQRVVVSGQDIFVLDTGRQLIQHFELDPTRNLVLNPDGETILAQSDNIDGVTVGRLVDITWLPPIAGVDDKAYLLVLDGTNNIFRYDRRVEGASRMELGGREALRTPTQLRVYADRLYLLDAGDNQIYRYARGDYANPPERWFGPQTQSALNSVRSMAIDGDIWLLYEQGLLQRYRTGDLMQFSLESSLGKIQDPVDLAVGDQGNSMIYVADSAEERILIFNKDGKYERQLRAPEGDVLRNLRGISVDEVAGTMYILTQSFLFNHPLPN